MRKSNKTSGGMVQTVPLNCGKSSMVMRDFDDIMMQEKIAQEDT